jgi:myo-inositol 2-dehydrogenase/D-chiro-inositol 1-dehydrogenase
VFESADALIDAVDAVYVTSPNRLHLEHALAALAHRKHVFCEKPMGVTLAEARSIAEGAAKAGTVFQVGHNRRFAPVYQALKAAITSPALGADLKMNRGELENPPWTVDEKITGGFLFETPIHIFDMARFLMGEIVEVTARAESQVYPTLDSFFALFRFDSGRTATFRSCAYTGWSFPFERVEVYAKHSTLATEEMDRIVLARGLQSPTQIAHYRHLPWEQRWGYVEEDRLFLDSIEKGTPPPVTALDGLRAVQIACAIYESARVEAPIAVEMR